MSYCKKKRIEPTVCYCLACEYCLPPSERIGGRMCENEVIENERLKVELKHEKELNKFRTEFPNTI